jgi:hypothetical protein
VGCLYVLGCFRSCMGFKLRITYCELRIGCLKKKKRVWDQKKKLYSRLVKGFRLREWGGEEKL